MPPSDQYSPPRPDTSDHAHSLVRAGLSAVPVVGGPAVELFQALVTPSLERRRIAWMEEVATGLRVLAAQGLNLSRLAESESFVTTLLDASAVALRTHKSEKLMWLKNAVLNATSSGSSDDDLNAMFIHYVDKLTVLHIELLHAFAQPSRYLDASTIESLSLQLGGPASGYADHGVFRAAAQFAFPRLADIDELYNCILDDLSHRRLIVSLASAEAKRANPLGFSPSDIGHRLLAFIAR